MASSSKRQCTFTDILRERYPLMKQGRESTEVYCTVCDCYISIKYKGAFDIDTHIKSNKHKNQLLTVSKTRKIDTIFQSASSQSKTKESAAEATLAFHTVKHHQSYNSMDCTGRLMKRATIPDMSGKFLSSGIPTPGKSTQSIYDAPESWRKTTQPTKATDPKAPTAPTVTLDEADDTAPLPRKQCDSKGIVILNGRNSIKGLKIQPASVTDFRNLSTLLATLKVAYHTYSLKDEREFRVVPSFRGVPKEIPIEEVKEDLLA
ncbi:hypothetical protein EVAR_46344_1 [Eumeta japonica]|uniref:Uncharacterized protein n=1 Tax=Eumeta variegata TaxID=151549 RepID=A0A4C1WUE5_EUMVA|nr:hypothetical protein EVAR_46344_1 [Eumeta japonica]